VTPVVRRLLAACVLAGGLLGLGVPTGAAAAGPVAFACPGVTLADAAENADAVFTGTVSSVRRDTGSPQDVLFVNSVDVDLVFKGTLRVETVSVVTRPSNRRSEGLGPLKKGRDYIFFGRALPTDEPAYVAGACSGTGAASDDTVARVEEVLGKGEAPVPPEQPAVEFDSVGGDDPTSFTRAAAPGLALVLIGLLGLVVVRRLGRAA
jgi:hypothetical protein